MNVAQSQTVPTAFRSGPSPYRAGAALPAPPGRSLPRRRVEPLPAPSRTGVRAPARVYRRSQSLWLLLIVVCALCSCCIGLLYLSSYAQLAREGYRRVQLLSALRTEQERSKEYQQLKAQVNTPDYIESKAVHQLHMQRAEDMQTVTIQWSVVSGQ